MGMQINDKIIGAAIIALVVLSGFAAYTFGHSAGILPIGHCIRRDTESGYQRLRTPNENEKS